jgi:hypothetical protein
VEYACFYHKCQFNFDNLRKTAPYNEHQFAALAVNVAIVTKQAVPA